MLQQTQVSVVLGYYARFLAAFPTVGALAAAREPAVLSLWSGLGYYSRARNLHRGAKYLVANHKGNFPKTRGEILAVPGIGPYTAGAVLSIAFDLKEALVDGNVQRVFARFYAVEDLLESKPAREFFWEKASEWVNASDSPRVFNQALMELGAMVCTKANPRCGSCPLAGGCRANAAGTQAQYPKRKARRKAIQLSWNALVHEKAGKLLMVQNKPGDWWHGLWDFPREEASLKPPVGFALSVQQHTVTHHRIHVAPIVLGWKGPTRSTPRRKWVTAEQARQLPLSSLAKKILAAYDRERGDRR